MPMLVTVCLNVDSALIGFGARYLTVLQPIHTFTTLKAPTQYDGASLPVPK